MTLTYELLQRDFYDALVAHRNRSAWTKWFLRFMVLVLVLAIGGVVFVAILGSDVHFATNNALPLLLLAVFWSLFLWVQPWLAAKYQFGKQTVSVENLGSLRAFL
jgi:membrane protein YdbS with pleckstrin-like domain